jgi:cobalt-precorrin 5A hydrolase
MRISVISFTARGVELSRQIGSLLEPEMELSLYTKYQGLTGGKNCRESGTRAENRTSEEYRGQEGTVGPGEADRVQKEGERPEHDGVTSVSKSLSAWTREQFEGKNALLFIGACGIAVRAIAPFLGDKLTDPPVLVMDEAGKFVIPILSGHYGGANALAKQLAEKTGATAVITTATDVNGLFAVDVFAKKNHLVICNRNGIEKVSSRVLEKKAITMAIAGGREGEPPKEVIIIPYPAQERVSVLISPFQEAAGSAELQLCPKVIVIGIGCRRGKTLPQIEAVLQKQVEKANIRWEAISVIASIDRKGEEEGLLELAEKYQLPFLIFTKEELNKVTGEFQSSDFVQEQVGVDNVCERSAMAASGRQGRLISEKYAEDGITIAIAAQDWRVIFDKA